jgi:hypothetical protein
MLVESGEYPSPDDYGLDVAPSEEFINNFIIKNTAL